MNQTENPQDRTNLEKHKSTYVMIGMPIPKDYKVDVQTGLWCGMMSTNKNVQIMGKVVADPADARNRIVKDVLADPKITHVFFIDADTRVPHNVLSTLLSHEKDIVAGITPMYFNNQKMWNVSTERIEGDKLRWLQYEDMPDSLFKAIAVGGTTVLVKREVLEKLEWPYYYTDYREDGGCIGEDVYFCNKVREAGFEIWIDPKVKCGHVQTNNLGDWFPLFSDVGQDKKQGVDVGNKVTDKVSFILPVVRPDKAKRCIEHIHKNAGIPEDQFEIVFAEDTDRIGCPKMVKRLVAQSKHRIVCFLGDDTIPQEHFAFEALRQMKKLPDGWGMVGLNDMHHNGNILATHFMADKRLLPLIGGEFFHTGYKHCFCDQELMQRCKQMGRYIWAKDAKLVHDHPVLKGEKLTGDYAKVYSKKYYSHDEKLFKNRKHIWGAA